MVKRFMAAPSTTGQTETRTAIFLKEPSWFRRNLWLLNRAFLAAYEDGCLATAKAEGSPWLSFWQDLDAIWQAFEKTQTPPQVTLKDKRYHLSLTPP